MNLQFNPNLHTTDGERNGAIAYYIEQYRRSAQDKDIPELLARPLGTTPYWVMFIMNDMLRIRLISVTISLGEGPTHMVQQPFTFHSWQEATRQTQYWRRFLRDSWYKVDFDLEFQDGEQYSAHNGTFCIHPHEYTPLNQHVREHQMGLLYPKPNTWPVKPEDRERARRFLLNYSLEDYAPFTPEGGYVDPHPPSTAD